MMTTKDLSQPVIRIAEQKDANAVSTLLQTVFSEAYGQALDKEVLEEHLEGCFSEAVIRGDFQTYTYFVIEKDLQLLGALKIDLDDKHKAEIDKLYVLKEARAHGIGALLMNTAIEWSTKQNATHIYLYVWEENHSAIRFYEKHQFEKVGTTQIYVGKTTFSDFVMEKAL